MPSSPLRIAILECDTPVPNVDAKYHGYAGVFKALFRKSATALDETEKLNPDTDLEISQFDIVNDDKYPRLEDVDAVLMTGSKYNSYEDLPWINRLVDFTRKVIEHDRVRIVGICFGHQIVGRALDAKVGLSDKGWEIAVCNVDLTEKGKELFGRDKLKIQQMHRDIVHHYPSNVIPLGSSPLCTVQGMYLPGRFITVQGHPEFNEEIVSEIVKMRKEAGIFSEEQYQDAINRAGLEHDGIAIGVACLRFLLE